MTTPERDALAERFKTAAAGAAEALAHDAAGRTAQAHQLWRGLLGEDYPATER